MKPLATFEGVEIDQMYREHLLDHYNNPRNAGTLENAQHFHDLNPLCGDEIEMFIRFKENTIENIKFKGQGCAISQASASILTEEIKGKHTSIIQNMNRDTMQDLIGIKIAAVRIKCMMLSLKVLKTLAYLNEGKKLEEINGIED